MNSAHMSSRMVGYRVGNTYCISPTLFLSAVHEVPDHMVQLPGTKPWVLGVSKLGKDLIPYINLPHFLNLPASDSRLTAKASSPALILREIQAVGTIGLRVDEVVGFISTWEIEDVDDPEFVVPIGFGSCLVGTVAARSRTWALIDLNSLMSDDKLQKIDLN